MYETIQLYVFHFPADEFQPEGIHQTQDPEEIRELIDSGIPYEVHTVRQIAYWFKLWFFLSIAILFIWGCIVLNILMR